MEENKPVPRLTSAPLYFRIGYLPRSIRTWYVEIDIDIHQRVLTAYKGMKKPSWPVLSPKVDSYVLLL